MLSKWLKNFQWMNIRVGKGFWKEKMGNLIGSTSFTKTVKFSIKMFSKMILIANYTCSQSINEKSHLCLKKYL